MATCTIFRNFTIPVEKKSLLLIANDIASDLYKVQVEEIRRGLTKKFSPFFCKKRAEL